MAFGYNGRQVASPKGSACLIPALEWVILTVVSQPVNVLNPGKRLLVISEGTNGRYSGGRRNTVCPFTVFNSTAAALFMRTPPN
jgi:hypothetical protein